MKVQIFQGSALERLKQLPSNHYHCCVTSPPYFGLRAYCDDEREIGREDIPQEYVARLVAVFEEVRRVLRSDGTFWLNLGDSYAGNGAAYDDSSSTLQGTKQSKRVGNQRKTKCGRGLKRKDLIGIPWRVALAIQEAGWYLRSDVIWQKPNTMPSSVTDRCSSSHEHVFMLTKSARYFADMDAVRVPSKTGSCGSTFTKGKTGMAHRVGQGVRNDDTVSRNLRDVWSISTNPFSAKSLGIKDSDHYAVMAPGVVERCLKIGTSPKGCCPECGALCARQIEKMKAPDRPGRVQGRRGDTLDRAHGPDGRTGNRHSVSTMTTGFSLPCSHNLEPIPCRVLDPFGGAGTTALVAFRLGHDCDLIELNPASVRIAQARIEQGSEGVQVCTYDERETTDNGLEW